MRLDVFFTPGQAKPADTASRLVVIVDVLRASTTVAAALGNGAKTVIPLEGADEVIFRSKEFHRSQILLAGEQKMHPITGFDLGRVLGDGPKQSGGIVLQASGNVTLGPVIAKIADNLLHQYAVTYTIPDGVKPNEKLQLTTSRKGVTLLAPSRLPDK